MALTAQGIGIDPTLKGMLSGQGSPGWNAYNTINSNYGTAKNQFASDASARGMNGPASIGPNSYAGSQFATKQGLDVGNLESALGGGLVNTSYQNTLQQRDFQQNEDLAKRVAALNKPDLLQQILGGVGNVGGTLAGIYGAWGKNASPSTGGTTTGSLPPSLSLIPGGGASGYYNNPYNW